MFRGLTRQFGLLKEYQSRVNQKLSGTH
jgi:ubiquinol-cytochrome c reductase iron-sulfur subunit